MLGAQALTSLGGYQAVEAPFRAVAQGVFVAILCLTAVLERLQYRLRASEQSVWWASNGRDVINTFALGTMVLGLHLLGFRGPVGLLIAGTLMVLLTAVQSSLEKLRHATLLSTLATLGLGAPVLFVPGAADRWLRHSVELLFP